SWACNNRREVMLFAIASNGKGENSESCLFKGSSLFSKPTIFSFTETLLSRLILPASACRHSPARACTTCWFQPHCCYNSLLCKRPWKRSIWETFSLSHPLRLWVYRHSCTFPRYVRYSPLHHTRRVSSLPGYRMTRNSCRPLLRRSPRS